MQSNESEPRNGNGRKILVDVEPLKKTDSRQISLDQDRLSSWGIPKE